MRIVITEFMDEAALTGFPADAHVIYDPTLVDDRPRLLPMLADADAVIVRNRTQVDAAMLQAAPKLRVVGRLGVGLDNIDMAACEARGVAVRPATGANTLAVAEYVISTAMMLRRGAYHANAAMLEGGWPRNALMGHELAGATMGLVGYGAIAQAVATRARDLGMTIAAFDPYLPADDPAWQGADRHDLPSLLAHADVLSLHVPLTDATHHMIDASALGAMKSGAVLINTARGGVVSESALADALRAQQIAGAALDVFETEPLTAQAARVFADIPSLILTPHIAGVTQEANIRVSDVTVRNVREVLETTL